MAQRMPPVEEVRKDFRQFGLAVYRITDPRKSFIVGYVKGAAARFRLPGGGMSRETMFLPLTWDTAVGHLTHARTVEIITVDRDQSAGENIASREVEEALYRHLAIGEAAVIGLPDPKWIEAVTAAVVLCAGVQATTDEILAHCAEHLSHFKVPKNILFQSGLPRNTSGKILKRELREFLLSGAARATLALRVKEDPSDFRPGSSLHR